MPQKEGKKVYIAGVSKLTWATGEMSEFASALRIVLEYLGEKVPYHFVMGTSGIAFRLVVSPVEWDPGNYKIRNFSTDPDEPIRRAFEDATEPDVLLFESLPEACDLPRFSSRRSSRRQTAHLARYISAIKSSFQELRGSYPRLLESVRQSFNEVLGLPHKDVHSVRDALKGNARYLQEFAIERDLKLLFSHILQDDLAPDAWLEGIASFLGERPMPKWRDEDIAHFSIRLRQFVRRMELLTITLSDRPMQAGKDFVESVRVSLTGTNFGQLDHAIHLDKSTVKQARRIEERVEAVLSDGTDATVAVGALCRLLKRRLEIPQSLSERSSV